MSSDDPTTEVTKPKTSGNAATSATPSSKRSNGYSIFEVPAPLKRIFDRFPLVVYLENDAPLRAPSRRDAHILHIFTTDRDARSGRPSFNPACLKWQTFLKISGVSFVTTVSTNHASPSGSLPFLLPATSYTEQTPSAPIPSNKLRRWGSSHGNTSKSNDEKMSDVREDAYMALLENSIRKAWLYQLYIDPLNSALVHRLYIAPCSSNIFVQMTIAYQLQRAAQHELTKGSTSNTIDVHEVMKEAKVAFEALSNALDDDEWFFGRESAGLYDASVFAYTHLILDEEMQWPNNELGKIVMEHGSLVQHRDRMLELYF